MNLYEQYMYSYPHKTAYRPLEGISLGAYAGFLSGRQCSLYLHIPFCQAKCGYCNLFSVEGQPASSVDAYLDAVERQSRQYAEVLEAHAPVFSELVIGGGTPLYLTPAQTERMFDIVFRYFRFSEHPEIIVETAPNQTTDEKLRLLRQAGVTRVSMGIQSFHNAELSALGRQHTADRAREAWERLRSFAFSCVNVDFIYGIPGQSRESLLSTLEEALAYEPDEIFLYPLYVKPGTGLEHLGTVADASAALALYHAGSGLLRERGMRQDSMRRFVRGQDTRQFAECGFGASLALGCGGRSYLGNLHFCSPYAVSGAACLQRLAAFERTQDYTVISNGYLLSEDEMKRRYVIRHLLIRPGLDTERYAAHYGGAVTEDFPLLQSWMQAGYLCRRGNYLTLTEQGLALSDCLGPKLISPQVRAAMAAWEENGG